jgi:hypothetical protein
MASAVKAVECKVFDIFDQLTCYRLNAQLQRFLAQFRRFQETQLDPPAGIDMEAALTTMDLDQEFEELFKIQQYDIKLQLTDKYQQLLKREQEP